jgi:hypothetical protein
MKRRRGVCDLEKFIRAHKQQAERKPTIPQMQHKEERLRTRAGSTPAHQPQKQRGAGYDLKNGGRRGSRMSP